jgi:ankyrin repeat protein
MSELARMLDWSYSRPALEAALSGSPHLEARYGSRRETPLHVAARRRRLDAVALLLDAGADINARTEGNKTAYAHCVRRNFDDVAQLLAGRGADTTLRPTDRFAVAVVSHALDEARAVLAAHPGVARTGNPEEDRLLADVAGRLATEPVTFLLAQDVDLSAPGLDGGTPLHQAAWFGSVDNLRALLAAGAPVDVWGDDHRATPLGWAAHGSRWSGGAAERQDVYVEIAWALLDAGATLAYPEGVGPDRSYLDRLRENASPPVSALFSSVL